MKAILMFVGKRGDGQEAIEKARQLQPDLIIMDLSMPKMNGLDAVRALRKLIPSIPIIVFSNHSDAFVKNLALSLGVAAVISKSQNISVLLSRARALFAGSCVIKKVSARPSTHALNRFRLA